MADIEKIKVGNTSYDVRDATTLQNLTSAQETTLINTGTYNGNVVADGTVFTTEEGKFKEFETEREYSIGTYVSVPYSDANKASLNSYEYKDVSFLLREGGHVIIADDGTTQTVYPVAFTTITGFYCNGYVFVYDKSASKFYVAQKTNLNTWTEISAMSGIALSNGNFCVVYHNGNYFFSYQKTNYYIEVTKLSADFSSATVMRSVSESSYAGWPLIASDGTTLCLFPGGMTTSYFWKSSDDGSSWSSVLFDTSRNIRGWTKIGSYIYLIDIANSKVVRTTDFSSFEAFSIATYSGSSAAFHSIKPFGNSLAVEGYSNGVFAYCNDLSTMTFTVKTAIASSEATILDTNSKGFVAGGYTVNDYYRIPVEETSTYSLTDLTPTVSVDQTYNSSSANAQSGVAINGAGFLTKDMSAIAIGTSASAVYQSIAVGQSANATGSYAIALGNNDITATRQCIAIGNHIETGSQYNAIAIGNGANGYSRTKATGDSSIAIGSVSQATAWNAIAVGPITYASSNSAIAIGYLAKAQANYAIQLGYGTNSTANTFSVGLSDSNNYELLDSSGHIPGPRMALQGSAAPDTSTVGSVGQFYVDTTNQDAYICVSDASSTYTWKKITP
jgi:hypothetical protein